MGNIYGQLEREETPHPAYACGQPGACVCSIAAGQGGVVRPEAAGTGDLEISDREKERVGRELHDGLCQNLAGIAALSATLSRKLAVSSDPAAVDDAEITRLLNETIGHAHDLARGLSPVGLTQLGLAAALEALAANVQALFRVSCAFQCARPVLRLDPVVETHLYRIIQEAVNNAITHGRGSRIEISLSCRNRQGRLSIRDGGVGISQKVRAGQGLGLHTMDYRSRLIGGSLQVQRLARRGTVVTRSGIVESCGGLRGATAGPAWGGCHLRVPPAT